MARISLKCGCGWNFFIAGTAQGHETPCPNCGVAVAIPGRKATGGGPKSPGVIAAEKQARQKQLVLLVSIGAAVLLVAVVLLVATSGSPKPISDEPATGGKSIIDRPAHQRTQVTGTKTGTDGVVRPADDPNTPVGANRETQIEELKKGIRANVWRLNLAGITTESLRLRNHADAVGALQERMKTWEAKISEALNALLELGERFNVDPHIQPGDRLVAFAQKEFATMRPADADQALLSPWLRSFRAGMPLEQLVILRGAQRIELYLQFPEGSEDLQGIARLPDITGPGRYDEPAPGTLPGPGPAIPLLAGPIPDAVFKDIEARFTAIPPGYRSMLSPVERGRLETLAKAKTGSADDQSFLSQRILAELLPAYEREAALVRAKAGELETKLKETTAVDVVHFKDGRKIVGQVLTQNEKEVKIKSKLGAFTVPMADVARIELGKGAGVEYPAKLAAAARTPEGLAALLGWCQTNGLKLEAEYTAALLLAVDPLHEAARKLSGLPPRTASKTSGSAPATGTGTMGAPAPASDQASRTADLLAGDVVKRYPGFGDVIAQMRAGSSGLVFASAPVPPARSSRAASFIKDPLSFDLTQLDASGALEIGQWWGSLPLEDRREFARYFGLCCAQQRHARGGR